MSVVLVLKITFKYLLKMISEIVGCFIRIFTNLWSSADLFWYMSLSEKSASQNPWFIIYIFPFELAILEIHNIFKQTHMFEWFFAELDLCSLTFWGKYVAFIFLFFGMICVDYVIWEWVWCSSFFRRHFATSFLWYIWYICWDLNWWKIL